MRLWMFRYVFFSFEKMHTENLFNTLETTKRKENAEKKPIWAQNIATTGKAHL